MKGRKTMGFLTAAAILAVATLVVVLFDPSAKHRSAAERGRVLKSRIPLARDRPKAATRISVLPRTETLPAKAKKPVADAKAAAEQRDHEEEKLLDQVTKELLTALDEAVKRGDLKTILALADKLRALNYGALAGGKSGGFASVKQRILDALADAGVAGIGPVIDLLGDADPVIVENAANLMFKSLNDFKVPDYDRAEIVTAATEELSNEEILTRLMNEFVKMRHSVGGNALKQIAKSGSDAAKAQLPRVISAFTGDPTVTTVELLDEWLEMYPDKRLDGWYYGKEDYKGVVE